MPERRGRAGREAGLERLWSPWRMEYIRRAAGRKESGCLFCRVARGRADRADLVLARRPLGLLILNRFPYNPGHVMVAPRRHAARIADLSLPERAQLLELTELAERALAAEYRPDGLNYGANAGRVAGAGFPGHFHLHLLPRWEGDTNFMPTVALTRVLPESLARSWQRLRRAVAALDPARGRPRRKAAPRRAAG